ncbi:MAG: GNAT family N-acetyltransferase [Devosia sp.]
MPEIRRLQERDREAWLALRIALWPREDASGFDEDITGILADPETMPAFGAFDGERLVGFAEAGERPWGDGCETAPVGWLEGIYIDPACRRHGIGRALVAAVTDWARARGYSELGSDAVVENHISLHSHARWGFVETERLVMFRKWLK